MSWYPNFNGSHFGLPPSSIHKMTGLGDKMLWTKLMMCAHRLYWQGKGKEDKEKKSFGLPGKSGKNWPQVHLSVEHTHLHSSFSLAQYTCQLSCQHNNKGQTANRNLNSAVSRWKVVGFLFLILYWKVSLSVDGGCRLMKDMCFYEYLKLFSSSCLSLSFSVQELFFMVGISRSPLLTYFLFKLFFFF